MTPEQKSRQQIDRQLELAGWIVQDYGQMNISAGLGVAVREFPLKTGDADYMLYADSRGAGGVEAKSKRHTLTGAKTQSGKYLDGLPRSRKKLRAHLMPRPKSKFLPLGLVYFQTTDRPFGRYRRRVRHDYSK